MGAAARRSSAVMSLWSAVKRAMTTTEATVTVTLTDFILARIAEDEAWGRSGDGIDPVPSGYWDNDRVLAECKAHRAIVAVLDMTPCPCQTASRCVLHDSSAGPPEFARERYRDPVTELTLRALAAIWADHEAFDESWAL